MTEDGTHSRRRVVQLSGTVTAGLLAGCSGLLPFSSSETTVIENVSFQGSQAVVHLEDGTNADEIDLHSPNDELLDTVSIGRKSKIGIRLRDDNNLPYAQGKYTLEAIEADGDGEPQTISTRQIELTSSFEITDIHPVKKQMQSDYTQSPPKTMGHVRISLKNTGTLPVPITYIGITKGVPHPNEPPSSQTPPGYHVVNGTNRLPIMLPSNETTTVESVGTPLGYYVSAVLRPPEEAVGVPKQGASWNQIKENQCNGQQHTAMLVVIPKQGDERRMSVTFKYGGNAVRGDAVATDYECTNVTVTNTTKR